MYWLTLVVWNDQQEDRNLHPPSGPALLEARRSSKPLHGGAIPLGAVQTYKYLRFLYVVPMEQSETTRKGAVGELKAATDALEVGFVPSWPSMDVQYDFIMDTGDELLRVQVKKLQRRKYDGKKDCWDVDLRNKSVASGGDIVTRVYGEDDFDVLALYNADHDEVYWLTRDDCGTRMQRTLGTWREYSDVTEVV